MILLKPDIKKYYDNIITLINELVEYLHNHENSQYSMHPKIHVNVTQ